MLVVAGAGASGGQAPPPGQVSPTDQRRFQSGIDIVLVDVTVLDRGGAPVTTLVSGEVGFGRLGRELSAGYAPAFEVETADRDGKAHGCRTPGSHSSALFAELRRVPSSNRIRRYLDTVIRGLLRLPSDKVQQGFWELASDSSFSYRMRAKFTAASEKAGYR